MRKYLKIALTICAFPFTVMGVQPNPENVCFYRHCPQNAEYIGSWEIELECTGNSHRNDQYDCYRDRLSHYTIYEAQPAQCSDGGYVVFIGSYTSAVNKPYEDEVIEFQKGVWDFADCDSENVLSRSRLLGSPCGMRFIRRNYIVDYEPPGNSLLEILYTMGRSLIDSAKNLAYKKQTVRIPRSFIMTNGTIGGEPFCVEGYGTPITKVISRPTCPDGYKLDMHDHMVSCYGKKFVCEISGARRCRHQRFDQRLPQ